MVLGHVHLQHLAVLAKAAAQRTLALWIVILRAVLVHFAEARRPSILLLRVSIYARLAAREAAEQALPDALALLTPL